MLEGGVWTAERAPEACRAGVGGPEPGTPAAPTHPLQPSAWASGARFAGGFAPEQRGRWVLPGTPTPVYPPVYPPGTAPRHAPPMYPVPAPRTGTKQLF